MLVQSHAGELHLLPALPSAWRAGAITGVRARGGFVVDLAWHDGALATGTITSALGGVVRLRTAVPITVSGASSRPAAGANPNPFFKVHDPGPPEVADRSKLIAPAPDASSVIEFTTAPGGRYTFRA